MARLKNSTTGVVVTTSDEVAEKLMGFESADSKKASTSSSGDSKSTSSKSSK